MDFNREKIFELGKSFDMGLVSFDALSDSEKYALNRYYANFRESTGPACGKRRNTILFVPNI